MRPGEYVQQLGDLCVLMQPQGGERILPLASLGQCRMEILGPRESGRECTLRISDPDGMALVSWNFADCQEAESLQALLLAAGRRRRPGRPGPDAPRAGNRMPLLRRFLSACAHIARIALGVLLAYLMLIGLSAIVTDTLGARLLGQTGQTGQTIQAGSRIQEGKEQANRAAGAQAVQGAAGRDQAGGRVDDGAGDAAGGGIGAQAAPDTGQAAPENGETGFNPDRLFDYSCE